jgi:hypothetical protein
MNVTTTYISQNPGIITNGLVAYYSFENPNCWIGSNVRMANDLVSSNTGSFGTSATISYNGNTGSLWCTGVANRNILCQNIGLTNMSASSFCFWTNFNGSSGQQGGVFAGGAAAQRNFQGAIRNNYSTYTGLEWYSSYTGEFFSNNVASVTGWHFWTIVHQNTGSTTGTISWYQDGNLINTTLNVPNNGPLTNTASYAFVTIGHDFYATYFRGFINSVAIYNRALSAAEVLYNYSAGKWRFS